MSVNTVAPVVVLSDEIGANNVQRLTVPVLVTAVKGCPNTVSLVEWITIHDYVRNGETIGRIFQAGNDAEGFGLIGKRFNVTDSDVIAWLEGYEPVHVMTADPENEGESA